MAEISLSLDWRTIGLFRPTCTSIRNLRLTVRRVIELLALYSDPNDLRREYPELEDEDIRQSLLYAATSIEDRMVEFALRNLSLTNAFHGQPQNYYERRALAPSIRANSG